MLACIGGCSGVVGFKAAMSLCPVREKVRPARPDVGVCAKSSPCVLKMAQNGRFMACWAKFFAVEHEGARCRANFFAEMPVEAPCWACLFAGQSPLERSGWEVLPRWRVHHAP